MNITARPVIPGIWNLTHDMPGVVSSLGSLHHQSDGTFSVLANSARCLREIEKHSALRLPTAWARENGHVGQFGSVDAAVEYVSMLLA